MKTVNGKLFKIMHKLNDLTAKWLKEAKTTIKENGIECVTFNKNKDIQFEYAKAPEKRAKEFTEEVEKLKAKFPILNADEKITKIVVKQYGNNEDEEALDLFNNTIERLSQSTDKSIARAAASITASKK